MNEHIAYRVEHDFTSMVDEIAAQIQHKVDQAALDKAAYTLEQFGYVKVVRCRDCKYADEVIWPTSSKVPPDYLDCNSPLVETWDYYNDEPKDNPVPPNGFCFHGERRRDDEE